jgi:3-deoxy-D-manno-octulosonic-acid transferase
MLAAGGAISADNAPQLTRALVRLLTDEHERADRAEAIGAVVATELGAADRSFEIVRELLGAV